MSTGAVPSARSLARVLAGWLLLLTAGVALTWQLALRADRQMRAELLSRAEEVARNVGSEEVRELSGTERDLGQPAYRRLKETLADACVAVPEYRFLYLLGQRSDGTVFFFADSEPDGAEDSSPPGQVYAEATAELREVFRARQPAVEGPTRDRWGVWVSAFVPLVNPADNRVLAVFGVDVEASTWSWSIAERVAWPVGGMLVLLLVGGTVWAATRPVIQTNKPVLRRLLPPLTVILLLVLASGGWLLTHLQRERMAEELATKAATANRELRVDMGNRTAVLGLAVRLLASDARTGAALQARDAAALRAAWEPRWSELARDGELQYLEFLDDERVCLLRMQAPGEAGDVVPRFTAREAARTGQPVSGLEIGPLGTLSLWVVQPVFYAGKYVGLLEAGQELDELLSARRNHAGLELAVWIKKPYQERAVWEAGQRRLGREANWDRWAHSVLTYLSNERQAPMLDVLTPWADFSGDAEAQRQPDGEVTWEGRSWQVSGLPLRDAAGRDVGTLMVLNEVTASREAFARALRLGCAGGGVLLAGLLGFVFVLLRRTDVGIRMRETELAASERKLRLLADNTDDFVTLYDAQWRRVYTSPAYFRRTGWTPEDLETQSWQTRMHPEDLPEIEAARRKAQAGEVAVFEHRIRCRDGSWLWVEARTKRLAGSPDQYLGTAHDISGRKHAELELLDLNRQLEHRINERTAEALDLYQNAPCGYLSLGPEGRILQINDTTLKWLGYAREEVEERLRLPALLTPESARSFAAFFPEFCAAGQSSEQEWDLRCADGATISVLVNSTVERDAAGQFQKTRSTIINITPRKQAEAQLRKLQSAIKQGPSVVVITDQTGAIEYVNPRFTAVTGWAANEVVGRNPRLLKSGVHPREFYVTLWQTLLAGQVWRGELCNRRKNGEQFWESAAIAPVRDEQGRFTHFVAIKEDITELRRVSQELRVAKDAAESANRAKTTFLASMSHEIRTPMNAILGFAQLLQRHATLSAQEAQWLATVNASGEHLLVLINDILDMSKIEAGRMSLTPADCDFATLLSTVQALFVHRAREKQLPFEVQLDAAVPSHLRLDASRVRQVLVNMLSNAVKFTHQGRIVLRIQAEPAEPTAQGEAQVRLRIEVEDTGPGIAPEELDRVFVAFEQTYTGRSLAGGTGLGMAISRQLARLMQGDVTVVSQVGVGSTFRFTFVAAVVDPARVAATSAPTEVSKLKLDGPAPRVLVVDDLAVNRELLRTLLEEAGFQVTEASGGAEAVAQCEAAPPDLVLMDRRMPGMDGLAAVRAIRAGAGGERVRILVVSADVLGTSTEDWQAAGVDGFVAKPYRETDLLARIGALLGVEYAPTAAAAAELPLAEVLQTVQQLPADLRAQLVTATEAGDGWRLKELIRREVAPLQPALAKVFSQWATQYDYKAILAALK